MLNISGICPYCEKIVPLERIQRQVKVDVRGETISVQSMYFRCVKCQQEFVDPETENDALISAYREYRHRHGMLQPEDIYRLRKLYNLTQKELSELLFCEEKVLSHFERGHLKLQTQDHDIMLKLIRNLLNNQK